MWQKISTDEELSDFIREIQSFHDSCIKEIKYVSGAYVNDDLSMYPINDRRVLNVVFQRQYENYHTIELEFSGLKFLNLCPVDDVYTCEITSASMFFLDGYIYWCENDDISVENLDKTMICATSLRWRDKTQSD